MGNPSENENQYHPSIKQKKNLGEGELGRKQSMLEASTLRAGNHAMPLKKIFLILGPGHDSLGAVLDQFLKELESYYFHDFD
jgi:hypothetical protein